MHSKFSAEFERNWLLLPGELLFLLISFGALYVVIPLDEEYLYFIENLGFEKGLNAGKI